MEIKLKYKTQTALVETKGGELVSYRGGDGVEYMWDGNEAYWSGRNPLLFPIVGAMPDNEIEVESKCYTIPKHGFARWREFTPVAQGESWCELELCSDAQTLEQYPFRFSLKVRHELTDAGFETAISIHNPDKRELPFCIGVHPAFRCPLRAGERYEDYVLKFDACEAVPTPLSAISDFLTENVNANLLEKGILVPEYAIFDRLDAVIFEGLSSTKVSLVHKKTGHGVQLDFSDFPVLAFWSMPHKNAPYLCVEPWHGYPDTEDDSKELRERRYCICLASGETCNLRYSVTVI